MTADPFTIMIRAMADQAADAFAAKFNRSIVVHPVRKTDDQGMDYVDFEIRNAKPGLLSTAIEREWLAGYIAGYKTATNIGMMARDQLLAADEQKDTSH